MPNAGPELTTQGPREILEPYQGFLPEDNLLKHASSLRRLVWKEKRKEKTHAMDFKDINAWAEGIRWTGLLCHKQHLASHYIVEGDYKRQYNIQIL